MTTQTVYHVAYHVHVVLGMRIVNTAVLTWSYKAGRESRYSLAFSECCGTHRFIWTYKNFRQSIQRTSTALGAVECKRQAADDDADSVWFHLQGSRIQKKLGLIGCLETSVRNYQCSLRNNPEERSSPMATCCSKRVTVQPHVTIVDAPQLPRCVCQRTASLERGECVWC